MTRAEPVRHLSLAQSVQSVHVRPHDDRGTDGIGLGGRMAVLLGSVIRNRNLARNHNLECGTHELLHCHHERAIRP